MINLEDLKTAKSNITQKRSGNAESAYADGLKVLELYKLKPSITRLDQAAKKFIEALEYNNEHIPSLVYISYVLYALGNEEMAMKYIRIVENLVPEMPPDIIRFKDAVEKRIAKKFNK